jgi:hypothetical protein
LYIQTYNYKNDSGYDKIQQTYYNSTLCDKLLKTGDFRLNFTDKLNCPDVPNINDFFFNMNGYTTELGVSDYYGYNFQMVVGYCEDLKQFSKQTNCVPKSQFIDHID